MFNYFLFFVKKYFFSVNTKTTKVNEKKCIHQILTIVYFFIIVNVNVNVNGNELLLFWKIINILLWFLLLLKVCLVCALSLHICVSISDIWFGNSIKSLVPTKLVVL